MTAAFSYISVQCKCISAPLVKPQRAKRCRLHIDFSYIYTLQHISEGVYVNLIPTKCAATKHIKRLFCNANWKSTRAINRNDWEDVLKN